MIRFRLFAPSCMKPRSALLCLCLALASSLSGRADEVAAVIAKARAYVGKEETLAALRSIHYVGTVRVIAEKPEEKPAPRRIEIIFQKPYQQRIVVTGEKVSETTALDDYEAWQRVADPADPSRWRFTLLRAEEIKRRRANVWENLAFYRGIESRGGQVDDLGVVEVDGQQCHKLVFTHDADIVFNRYFSVATGRLVLTEAGAGLTEKIREEGELLAGGLRFSRRLRAVSAVEGREHVVVIDFDSITVNESFPASLFAVPSLPAK